MRLPHRLLALLALVVGIALAIGLVAPAPASAAEFAGRGGLLIARRLSGGGADIYLRDVGTNKVRKLTDQPAGGYATHHAAVWSPDGTKIAYVRQEPNGSGQLVGDVWVMNADGSGKVNISDHATANDDGPAWSPDSSKVVYGSNRSGGYQLYITALATPASVTPLTLDAMPADTESFSPAWSPDGSHIAFAYRNAGDAADSQIYRINVSSLAWSPITQAPGLHDEPEYSPDGAFLAFSSNRANPLQANNYDIYARPAAPGDSSQDRLVAGDANFDRFPQWVPRPSASQSLKLSYAGTVITSDGPMDELRTVDIDETTMDAGTPTVISNTGATDFEGQYRPLPGCSIVWTGAALNGNYTNASNWYPARIPTSADSVCIPQMAENPQITILANAAAATLRSDEPITLASGSLTASSIDAPLFNFTGGTLRGSGTFARGEVRVGGSAYWESGNVWTVADGATLRVTSTGNFDLPIAVVNKGTVDLGDVTYIYGAGTISNLDAATAGDADGGTITKAGTHTLSLGKELDNDGRLDVTAGTVSLTGDDAVGSADTGDFRVFTDAVLRLAGTTRLGSRNGFKGPGEIRLSSGALYLGTGGLDIPGTFYFDSGTLHGSGTLDSGDFRVGGNAYWGSNAGPWTIAPDATFTLTGSGNVDLPVALTNKGVVDLGSVTYLYGTGQIDNVDPATAGNATGGIVRTGTAGAVNIAKNFDNDGRFEVHSGTATLSGNDVEGSSDSGTFQVADDAVLSLSGTTRLTRRDQFQGTGQFRLVSGSLYLGNSGLDIPGTFYYDAGNLYGSGDLSSGEFRVGGNVTWPSSGSGPWTVARDAVFKLNGAGTVEVGVALENKGLIDVGSVGYLYGAGDITNVSATAAGTATGGVIRKTTSGAFTLEKAIDNEGRIEVDGGELTLSGNDAEGSTDGGVIDAAAGTVVRLQGTQRLGRTNALQGEGQFRFVGGSLYLAEGGLDIPGTFYFDGGYLYGSGLLDSGEFRVGAGAQWPQGAGPFTVDDDAVFSLKGSGNVDLPVALTNEGVIDVGTVGYLYGTGRISNVSPAMSGTDTGGLFRKTSSVELTVGKELDNDGMVRLDSGTLTLAADDAEGHTDDGAFVAAADTTVIFGAATRLGRADSLTGAGTYRLRGGALHVHADGLDLPGTFSFDSGQLLGSGTLSSGVLEVGSGATWPSGSGPWIIGDDAKMAFLSEGFVDFPATVTNEGTVDVRSVSYLYGSGRIDNAATGTLLKSGVGTTHLAIGMDNLGKVRVEKGGLHLPTDLTSDAAPIHDGVSIAAGPYEVVKGAVLRFNGTKPVATNTATFRVAGLNSVVDDNGSLFRNLQANGGELEFGDGSRIATNQLLTNTGLIRLKGDSILDAQGGYAQTAGTTHLYDATTTLVARTAAFAGGTVQGTGTIDAEVTNTGAVVAPGNSPGTLNVDGTFVQSGNGVLQIQIDAADVYDKLDATGAVQLGGTVEFRQADNVVIGFTDALEVVDSAAAIKLAEGFTFEGLPAPAAGSQLKLEVEPATGALTLTLHDIVNPFTPVEGAVASTTHTAGVWSTARTIALVKARDSLDNENGSGFAGYDVTWKNAAGETVGSGMSIAAVTSGRYTALVRTRDAKGNLSDEARPFGPYLVDATAPTNVGLTSPTASPFFSLKLSSTKVPQVTAAWKAATDAGTGLRDYTIKYRSVAPASTTWSGETKVTKAASATRSLTVNAKPGHTYCFTLSATDKLGNPSATTAPKCVSAPVDSADLVKAGTWKTPASSSSYYKSTVVQTTTAGSTLTIKSIKARRISLIATTCKDCGRVEVWLGKTKLATKALTVTPGNKVVIPIVTSKDVLPGALTVKAIDKGKVVKIDAIAISAK